VRVIRTFRPDVIITRFPPEPSTTHGHHTASAVLAIEAFKLAGDPKAFPEQLRELSVWQPKRILQNSGGPGGRNAGGDAGPVLKIEAGGNDPVTGESFASIASRSRAMHKTQGFGNFGGGPGGGGGGPRPETFRLLDGAPATNDILDDIDPTWARFPNGAEIGKLADEAIAQFKPENPAASVPALLAIRSRLGALPVDPVVTDKRRQLDRILQHSLGLTVETTLPQAEVVPGEPLKLSHTATITSAVAVRWTAVRYPAAKTELKVGRPLAAGTPVHQDSLQILPSSAVRVSRTGCATKAPRECFASMTRR